MKRPRTYTVAEFKALEANRQKWIDAYNTWAEHPLSKKFGGPPDIFMAGILMPFAGLAIITLFIVLVKLAVWI